MFIKESLALENTLLFSELFRDYINEQQAVKPFYDFHISQEAFDAYIEKNSFDAVNRSVLMEALNRQGKLVENTHPATWNAISSLEYPTTYTVTTGHQLCLFTGPLYFIYKIISAINLAKALRHSFPDKDFVPVYWMASEDHDFEEINHVYAYGKKVTWNTSQKGSVGEFSTEGLQETLAELKTILGESDQALAWMQVLEQAYAMHTKLADATRFLVNELFGEYGLVILDGNDAALKRLFKEEIKADIFENQSHTAVQKTIGELKPQYPVQVNPREINIFYKEYQLRERLEKEGENYKVLNTPLQFTQQELEDLIDKSPEKLSPNVVMRPLYQQKILPNVAYVGGPGEIAYWLEYKHAFEVYGLHFPILMPRHFVMLLDKGIIHKLQKLHLTAEDAFKDVEDLVKQFIKMNHDVSMEEAKEQLSVIYAGILEKVTGIDKTLAGTTEAEKQKAINGIAHIEQKINRALKQKSEHGINQIRSVKGKLFPDTIPQERYENVSMYYSKYGRDFIKELMGLLVYDLKSFQYTILSEE